MKMVTVSTNEFFFYKETQNPSVEVFYVDTNSFTYWHFLFKPTTDDIAGELPSALNNPDYETEGESVSCTSMEELLNEVPSDVRAMISVH